MRCEGAQGIEIETEFVEHGDLFVVVDFEIGGGFAVGVHYFCGPHFHDEGGVDEDCLGVGDDGFYGVGGGIDVG